MSENEFSIKKYISEVYLERAKLTLNAIPRCKGVGYLINGIKNEVGELYGVIKKAQREEDLRCLPHSFYDKAYKELGDCFWYTVISLEKFKGLEYIPSDQRMFRIATDNIYSIPVIEADNFFIDDVCLMYGLTKDEYLAGCSSSGANHVLPFIFDIEDILDEVLGICSTISSKSVLSTSPGLIIKKIVKIFERLVAVNKILISNDSRCYDIFHVFTLNNKKTKTRHEYGLITGSGDDREHELVIHKP